MTRCPRLVRQAALACAALAFLALAAPTPGGAADYTDGQLKSFAMAWTSINQLAERYKPQVEAAASEAQAVEMLEQFEAEVDQVIENTDGIGVQDYNNIIQAAQSDPALKERILAMLEEMQPSQ
jgi:hypothetical protein